MYPDTPLDANVNDLKPDPSLRFLLVVGAIRTVTQVFLVGYLLVYIFALDRWYLVAATLILMLIVATRAAVNRQGRASRKLLMITGASILVSSGFTVLYGLLTGVTTSGQTSLQGFSYSDG